MKARDDLCRDHVHIRSHVVAIHDTIMAETAHHIGAITTHSVGAQGDVKKIGISE